MNCDASSKKAKIFALAISVVALISCLSVGFSLFGAIATGALLLVGANLLFRVDWFETFSGTSELQGKPQCSSMSAGISPTTSVNGFQGSGWMFITAAMMSIAFFAVIATDYTRNSQTNEMPWRMATLKPSGHSFNWRNLSQVFRNTEFVERGSVAVGQGRGRFLSYGLEYLNMCWRLFLWRFIVPHPSLSFVWLFSFASLWLLYKAARTMGYTWPAALMTVIV